MTNRDTSKDIYILGGHQTDFAKNYSKQNQDLFDVFAEGVNGALQSAQLDAIDIQVGHVGNFVAELFTGQGMIGGFFGHVHPDFSGMPAGRHEAACASGSLAILAAISDIQSGRYDVACAAGVEYMRNVPASVGANNLRPAVWEGKEAIGAEFVWPHMFSNLCDEYDKRYGLKYEHLAEISKINFTNAKKNPNAQTRDWAFNEHSFTDNDIANPVVDGWMRRHDCSQITDGAAVVILASPAYAQQYCTERGLDINNIPKIMGWGHTTAPMLYDQKIKDSQGSDYVFPWVKKAIHDAYARAGISGVAELDGLETHDCFTINEYMAIEHFGITKPGEAWKAIEAGRIAADGDIPVNIGGGLMGIGHPVGCTGIRMVWDMAKQTTDRAGEMQIAGAKKMASYNVGGSATTNCSFVVGLD